MLIKYYKDKKLAYANRIRYAAAPTFADAQETQKSVLLGDGATTSIKTKAANLCNYVTIDDTRWYVMYHRYLNGGQVEMFLQRDVIGENGVQGMFGKIERGHTDTFLKNRKELSLNQRLVNRTALIPNKNQYGNINVNTHENEMWGIMYFSNMEDVSVNIPALNPNVFNYPVLADGTVYNTDYSTTVKIYLNADISITKRPVTVDNPVTDYLGTYQFQIVFWWDKANLKWQAYFEKAVETNAAAEVKITLSGTAATSLTYKKYAIDQINDYISTQIINKQLGENNVSQSNIAFRLPTLSETVSPAYDYDGVILQENNNFYSYSATQTEERTSIPVFIDALNTFINGLSGNTIVLENDQGGSNQFAFSFTSNIISDYYLPHSYKTTKITITRKRITAEEAGAITITASKQLLYEPYNVLVCPLYDVTISTDTGEAIKQYIINRQWAFEIFNETIAALTGGSNPYLIDAQIFPYCPPISGVGSLLTVSGKEFPLFSILGNTYNYECSVNLSPNTDVKKEYIQREYSIISPEQSGKFTFNFYDYKTSATNLNVLIKTSLKPFGIISAAVIQPDEDALIGQTYESDLRGCQPTPNGFQCSLSSDAFETYRRENSNYQQIFDLQRGELTKQHEVERVNEKTQAIVNTITATTFGAIGGYAMADTSWFGTKVSGAVGAGIGGTVSGTTVGIAQAAQYAKNEELRRYEETLQKQNFDLQIGTIKNLPNAINRISTVNEIVTKTFWYYIETYECSDEEKRIVETFINNYGYGIGVFGLFYDFAKIGWFLRGTLISSNLAPNLHNVASNELMGGIYYYDKK